MAETMHEVRSQITFPVDPDVKARLQAAAEREDRTLASYVRRLCTKALEQELAA